MATAAHLVLMTATIAVVADARGRADLSPRKRLSAHAAGALPPCRACYSCDLARFGRNQWEAAALEEGLDLNNVSLFGRTIMKVKRSDVERLWHLNHSKAFDYNYMGQIDPGQAQGRRAWVLPWASEHFSKNDFLKIRDTPNSIRVFDERGEWQRLGPFDYTDMDTSSWGNDPGLTLATGISEYPPQEYWQVMASSKYTLCPGGSEPFSWRIFEAIAAGSLPVIKDPKEDWVIEGDNVNDGHFGPALQAVINKMHFVLLDSLPLAEYPWTLVQENWRTFIRYLTFMEGDNELPGLMPCTCQSQDHCHPEEDGTSYTALTMR